ncbi:MAG: hypothetical protein NEA02_11505 [Thermoanaerobaculia bacterium]|nr:hypothetical protein [Thermoanaerobaculia bacterium]
MVRRAWVLALTLLPAIAAGGAEPLTGDTTANSVAPAPLAKTSAPEPPAASSRPPLVQQFHLFPLELARSLTLDVSDLPEEKRLFHQQGDPDSLFTLGDPSPGGKVRLKAAIEVNELFLKAIPPDGRVGSADTRPRAAGSFLPLDLSGRPYQLRLGARLVW